MYGALPCTDVKFGRLMMKKDRNWRPSKCGVTEECKRLDEWIEFQTRKFLTRLEKREHSGRI